MSARLPRPPKYDVNTDSYPDDDYYIEQWKRTMLNRIDQESGCVHLVMESPEAGPDYCGLPEHDPFTNRCWDHTPGNLPHGGP